MDLGRHHFQKRGPECDARKNFADHLRLPGKPADRAEQLGGKDDDQDLEDQTIDGGRKVLRQLLKHGLHVGAPGDCVSAS